MGKRDQNNIVNGIRIAASLAALYSVHRLEQKLASYKASTKAMGGEIKKRDTFFISILNDHMRQINYLTGEVQKMQKALVENGLGFLSDSDDEREAREEAVDRILEHAAKQTAITLQLNREVDPEESALWFDKPLDDYDLSNVREKMDRGLHAFRGQGVRVSGAAVAITDAQPGVYFGIVWVNGTGRGMPPSVIHVAVPEREDGEQELPPGPVVMMNMQAVIGSLVAGGWLRSADTTSPFMVEGLDKLPRVRFLDIQDYAGADVESVG